MTQRSGLPPWFYGSRARPPADLPEMEPLRPKLPEPKTRKPQARPKQKTSTKRATTARATSGQPRIRRGPSLRAKRIQAQSQPRDQQGRFAEKGNWLTRLLDPTPRPPTRLKKINKLVPNGPPPAGQGEQKAAQEARSRTQLPGARRCGP